ncbi:MAG: MFS transporter [Acidobacteriota bacterium]|nr:MFS transporter [Acidobacteriota bacterium]
MSGDVEPTERAPSPAAAPPPASARWTVLVLVSVAMFGNYYVYDSIGPLADHLQRLLGFTDTQIGTLNAIYSFPNILMVLVGGIIVDRIGTRRATFAFTAICLVGALVTALSSQFAVMAVGRLIFGLGAESMIVAITTTLGQWFVGRQLGFAFGVNLSIARAGSYAADMSPTWARTLYDQGWQPPLVLAAGLAAVALLAALGYLVFERATERRYSLERPAPPDRVVWRELVHFDRSYWYVVGLCVTFYSVIFPFRSTFAIKYFQHAHGLTLQEAGTINGYVFLAAIFATPLFGLLADKIGHRALLMTGGTLLLFLVFPVLGHTRLDLWVSTVLIGVAFSLVPAVMWPAVTYLVKPSQLGTAYGLMTMLQNIGLTVFNLAAGGLNDASGASADNPGGYLPMLWMFGALSLFGLVFAWALRRREMGPHGHHLERPTPRSKFTADQ